MSLGPKIRSFSHQLINELQVVIGTAELRDYEASDRACERMEGTIRELRAEIAQTAKKRHKDEIATIKALMPRKGL